MTLPRPQRIFPISAPGSLLKRFAAPEPQIRSVETYSDRAYLENVRECPCLVCGLDPCGEAAHVRFSSAAYGKASGLQKTPADRWALPVCGMDHRVAKTAQHNRNEQEFWASLGINALLTCHQLYAKRGDLVAMRAVVFVTIAGRASASPAFLQDRGRE